MFQVIPVNKENALLQDTRAGTIPGVKDIKPT
jgi:hypothetical protein